MRSLHLAAGLALGAVVVPALAADEPPPLDLPGYVASPLPEEFRRNAVPGPDGMATIPAGGHTPAVNAFHRRICESLGSTDVTDDADLEIESGTIDAAVCISTNPRESHTTIPAEAAPTDSAGRIYLPIPARGGSEPKSKQSLIGGPLQILPHAANGAVPASRGYTVYSWAQFIDVPSTNQASVVSTAFEPYPCGWKRSGLMGPGRSVVDGFVHCMAGTVGSASSQVVACWGMNCRSDAGTVVHY